MVWGGQMAPTGEGVGNLLSGNVHLSARKCVSVMLKWKLPLCRSCHYFLSSSLFASWERQQYISVREAVVLASICSRVSKNTCVPPWSLGKCSPSARCSARLSLPCHLPSKDRCFWKMEAVGIFSTFENTSDERKDKAIRTFDFLVCRNLFFHQTTKPLALASSAVSQGFICGQETSAC